MTAALIITSGKTANKDSFAPLMEIGTITAIQRIISVFQRAGIERVVLVCDGYSQKAEKLSARMHVVCLHIEDGAEMLDSVKLGLSYLQERCRRALITPVDIPLFTVETVHALLESDADVCAPEWGGIPGHPLLLSAEHFPLVLKYSGKGGLTGAIEMSGLTRHTVKVSDKGILVDIQRESELGALVTGHSLMKLHPEIRLRLAREKVFFDAATQQLLMLTEDTGNLREACQQMGISYSKGWNMVSLMEEQLGFPVFERQQGGRTGGSSSLTPAGSDLLRRYSAFCNEIKDDVTAAFRKHFQDWQTSDETKSD